MRIPISQAADSAASFPSGGGRHLTYCLNIHAGESWAEVFEAIQRFPTAVRRRVAPGQPFGLGLRLGHRAAIELLDPRVMAAFRAFLGDRQFYVFTINGFPYGPFHGTAVKDAVYRPDWTTPERRDYTLNLARILAALLPDGISGSISTVPLSYRPWRQPPEAMDRMIGHLVEVVLALAEIHEQQHRELHLGLEPEPDCVLETTPEVIDFFECHLIPVAVPLIATARGCSTARAETLLRRHLGVCFDTCHLALQYETLAHSLDTLSAAGIRISKIQLSAALKTRPSAAAAARLQRFTDPVYLHQVKARGDGQTVTSRGDLEQALERTGNGPTADREWRIHCHVPLHFEGDGELISTGIDLDAGFFDALHRHAVEHLEIETYTFDVLPAEIRAPDVVESIAAEYAWVLTRLGETTGHREKNIDTADRLLIN